LKGEDIPLEARIIAVVDSYDLKANSRFYSQKASPKLAVHHLIEYRGSYFDPDIVNAFFNLLKKIKVPSADKVSLPISELKEGMQLSRDLSTKSGLLLLQKDTILQEKDLERIYTYHAVDPVIDEIFVYKHDKEDDTPQKEAL
jgi:hypothetical protein